MLHSAPSPGISDDPSGRSAPGPGPSARLARPIVVLSDIHLEHQGSEATAEALGALVRKHAGHEILLAGDVFGLSNDPPDRDPLESLAALLGPQPALLAALRSHLASGAPITLLAGNHDAAVGSPGTRDALLSLLELDRAAPLAVEPWFVRRGSLHVEHGNVWDPDNAPVHPLAPWTPASEPLGIALTRRFVAKNRVWEFAHAHETTLSEGMRRAYALFGVRTPLLVYRYFSTSAAICFRTLVERGGREREAGGRALSAHASRLGFDEAVMRELLAALPSPTHTAPEQTFMRLYYDRVLATLALILGVPWALARLSPAGLGLSLAAAGYLSWNVRHSGSRYQNLPIPRLREGAAIVRELTGAGTVVFGHTHVPEASDGYRNTGSFGYPPEGAGRPYAYVTERGEIDLRRFAGA